MEQLMLGIFLAIVTVPGVIAYKLSGGDPAATVWTVIATLAIFCTWGVFYGRKDSRRKAAAHQRREEALRISGLDTVDSMTGVEFEHYVAAVFRANGYQTSLTKATGDFGVDIIAVRGAVRTAVQCKRQATPVGASAVQQVVAGSVMHQCTATMVVCNRTFTRAARELARQHRCELVDRQALEALALGTSVRAKGSDSLRHNTSASSSTSAAPRARPAKPLPVVNGLVAKKSPAAQRAQASKVGNPNKIQVVNNMGAQIATTAPEPAQPLPVVNGLVAKRPAAAERARTARRAGNPTSSASSN